MRTRIVKLRYVIVAVAVVVVIAVVLAIAARGQGPSAQHASTAIPGTSTSSSPPLSSSKPKASASSSPSPGRTSTPTADAKALEKITPQLVPFLKAYNTLIPGESLPQRTARIEAYVPKSLWPTLDFSVTGAPAGAKMTGQPELDKLQLQVPRASELYVIVPVRATLTEQNGKIYAFTYLTASVWERQGKTWTIIQFAEAVKGGA